MEKYGPVRLDALILYELCIVESREHVWKNMDQVRLDALILYELCIVDHGNMVANVNYLV